MSKKNIMKNFHKQISYQSSKGSKIQKNLIENLYSQRRSKKFNPYKKISIFKFKKNKIFKIINEIQIIPRKIKSSKYINKLFLGDTEKSKIKRKKNDLEKTTIPYLGGDLNFFKNIKNDNNINLIGKSPQLISLAIPQVNKTSIKFKKK